MGRLHRSFHAPPALHNGALWKAAFQDFIPSHDALASLGDVGAHFIDESRLKGSLVFQPQALHFRLAFGAVRPSNFGHLITADVNDVRREQVAHFIEHGLHERHGRVISSAVHVFEHPPVGRNRQRIARAPEPWVRCQGRATMARHLDFRDDRHVPFISVLHDLLDVLLRVEATSDLAVGLGAKATNFRQFGVSLDGKTPSLVFGQMPMQHIHLLQGQHVDDALDKAG